MILTIRPARREEAKWLTSHLRFEDRREMQAFRGSEDIDLSGVFDICDETYSLRFSTNGKPDRDPVALFGVGHDPVAPHRGIPWFLAADGIERGGIAVLREARFWLDAWAAKYRDGLHNIVDARNTLHIRWLRATGCKLDGTAEVNGFQFLHFTRF